jgi:hypothetical protein
MSGTALQRIMEYSMPEPNSGCWLWLRFCDARGYGRIHYKGQAALAHRVAYECIRGAIPPKLHLCHKCDNPGCVNPDHMFVGTPADNVADMLRKGRESRAPRPYHQGRGNPNAKITEDVVRAILLSPLKQREAAAAFGVAPSWVQRVRKREVWKHVEVPADQIPPRRFFGKLGRKLTGDQVAAMRLDTRPTRTIARDYGVSPDFVRRVQRGHAWKVVHRRAFELGSAP